jgi:hypothetical protein
MNIIDIFATGVVALLFGLLMMCTGGFGATVGFIIFCYGFAAIIYAAFNKFIGRNIV